MFWGEGWAGVNMDRGFARILWGDVEVVQLIVMHCLWEWIWEAIANC